MLYEEESKEHLLPGQDDGGFADVEFESTYRDNARVRRSVQRRWGRHECGRIASISLSLMLLSLLGNFFLLYKYIKLQQAPDLGRSNFSKHASFSHTHIELADF